MFKACGRVLWHESKYGASLLVDQTEVLPWWCRLVLVPNKITSAQSLCKMEDM